MDVSNALLTGTAVVASLLAAGKAGYDMWAGRRNDNQNLEIAKRQAPEVQKQLELGNFKAAMEGVNIAQTIMSSELQRLKDREAELEEELNSEKILRQKAERKAAAAEKRADAAEARAARVESLMARLETRCSRLEDQVASLQGKHSKP